MGRRLNKNWLVLCDDLALKKRTRLLLNRENKSFDSSDIFGKWLPLGDVLEQPFNVIFDFLHLKKIDYLFLINLSSKFTSSLGTLDHPKINNNNTKLIFLTLTKEYLNGDWDKYFKSNKLLIHAKNIISVLGDISEKRRHLQACDDDCSYAERSDMLLYDDLIKFVTMNTHKDGIIDAFDFKDNVTCDVASFQLPWEPSKFIPNRTIKSIDRILHTQQNCSFDLIYRCDPYQISLNKSIASIRYNLGNDFRNELDNDIIDSIDYVVPVPETGKMYAQGLAEALNKPYLEAIYKRKRLGRSFDIQSVTERKKFIVNKLGLIPDLIKDKSIALVDEAIFTGATLKIVVELFQEYNVRIHILIPSPECINQCQSNMQPSRAMLLEYVPRESLRSYFNVDSVTFISNKRFEKGVITNNDICTFCFNNKG